MNCHLPLHPGRRKYRRRQGTQLPFVDRPQPHLCERAVQRVLALERHCHDPASKSQQVDALAISAPAAAVKSCAIDVFADCSTSFIQSEIFSPRTEVEQKCMQRKPHPLPITGC